MNAYDFHALNDKEFEALVADLLSARDGVHVERFKPGRDKGVDGRWFSASGGEVIVQCKHWVVSGLAPMMRHLRQSEAEKVRQLAPTRYVFATSVALSRNNKHEIAKLFAPYVRRDDDVLGQEDLNTLLTKFPNVEKAHYKLWITSANTLSLLLNRAIAGRSAAEIDEIRDRAKLFVETSDYVRARAHLEEKRVLILTGEPGAGKTTVAGHLVLAHVTDGFELVAIEENVSEAESVFSEGTRQIFYFDDFLGRAYLEGLRAKQDSHITSFMKRVSRDGTKRFILTSRTNILNQGAEISDLLAEPRVEKARYEIAVQNIRKLDRARILYNHMWHSKLDPEYMDQLYANKRYHIVVDHPNFNPRLIAFILDVDKVAGRPASEYWNYVRETLANPREVWRHFFTAQLSPECRDLVFIVVLHGGRMLEADLRSSFRSVPRQSRGDAGDAGYRFLKAVQHAVGSVLNRQMSSSSDGATYTLFNPSLADFSYRHLAELDLWEYYFPCIRTVGALTQLEQLRRESFFGEATYLKVLMAVGSAELARAAPSDAYSLRVARLVSRDLAGVDELREIIRPWFQSPDLDASVISETDYMRLLAQWRGVVSVADFRQAVDRFLGDPDSWLVPIDEPDVIAQLMSELYSAGLYDSHAKLRGIVLDAWQEQATDMVSDDGIASDYFDHEDPFDTRSTIREYLARKLGEMGVSLQPQELAELLDCVDLDQILERNVKSSINEYHAEEQGRILGGGGDADVAAIDDLFDRGAR